MKSMADEKGRLNNIFMTATLMMNRQTLGCLVLVYLNSGTPKGKDVDRPPEARF